MRDNFIRCAAVSPDVTVADPLANELSIKAYMDEAAKIMFRFWYFPNFVLQDTHVTIFFYRIHFLRTLLTQ